MSDVPAASYKVLSVMLGYPTEATLPVVRGFLGTDADLGDLRRQYHSVFGGPLPGTLPPLEAEYDQAHVFSKAQTLADLAGFYRAFGVESVGGLHRLDHIAVELEFAHVLAAKEARAAERGEAERAATCREARRILLAEHLGAWGIPYLGRVDQEIFGVYAGVAERARAFLLQECRDAGIALPERPARRVETPRPTGEETCPAVRGAIP